MGSNNFKEEYLKIIYTNLTISAILILIILIFAVFIILHISKIVNRYYVSVYQKHEKFIAAKIGKLTFGVFDKSYDNEVYVNVDQEESDKTFYTNTAYDTITKEIENMIEVHSNNKDTYSKRLQEYKQKTGHDLPDDTINSTALMKEYDDW